MPKPSKFLAALVLAGASLGVTGPALASDGLDARYEVGSTTFTDDGDVGGEGTTDGPINIGHLGDG